MVGVPRNDSGQSAATRPCADPCRHVASIWRTAARLAERLLRVDGLCKDTLYQDGRCTPPLSADGLHNELVAEADVERRVGDSDILRILSKAREREPLWSIGRMPYDRQWLPYIEWHRPTLYSIAAS